MKLSGRILQLFCNVIPNKKVRRELRQHLRARIEDWAPEYVTAQNRINASKNLVDLGCGTSPHPRAKVGVDWFLEPEHRLLGAGNTINPDKMAEKGVKFVHANLEKLPFADKEFDFAYSHHVIEHVENPHIACEEMMRIANEGVIMCPSAFAEIAFGRPYHLWQVTARGNTLIFIRKRKVDDCPFGLPMVAGEGESHHHEPNPFDVLLDEGNMNKKAIIDQTSLSEKLRKYWYSHSPVCEIVFNWTGRFDYLVIGEEGDILANSTFLSPPPVGGC